MNMHKPAKLTLLISGLTLLASTPALAMDARSAGLGGSSIAHGKGVHGAYENPSSLMRMKRDGQVVHLHLGASMDVQDDAQIVDTVIDEETLPEDIEAEIDSFTGSVLSCDFNSAPETVCLTGTQRLAELSSRVLDVLNSVDGKPVQATAAADFGVAYTKWAFPIAMHYRTSVTGAAATAVAQSDLDYVNTFATVLVDDQLTFDELASSVPLSISADGQTLSVVQPEDALESDLEGSALVREQLGLSMATSIELGGFNVDIGITPKFSELRAASLSTEISDRFDDTNDSLEQQFEDNEIVDTTMNMDVGASLSLNHLPLRLSVVARNLAKETITTRDNFVFETTPQLIVGGAFSLGSLTITGDMALNEAKADNLDTQIVAVGVELGRSLMALRAGISHDNARNDDATALSLGFSLGPVHVGGRITDLNAAQLGAQLAFSF